MTRRAVPQRRAPLWIVALLSLVGTALRCGEEASRSQSPPRPLLVFAAASLEDSMREVATAFEERSGQRVELNAAGSNVLAQQIQAGAPADLFVSADARWIDDLVSGGFLEAASRRELLTNRLVVIAHPDAGYSLGDVSRIGALPFRYLSIADPESVPAGRYARSLLEHTAGPSGTAWDEVAARVVPAPDVRAALAMVAAEPQAVGIVYRSDVRDGQGVAVLLEIERELDPPIRYVAARVRREGTEGEPRGAAFLDFLAGAEARAIFERHGFIPLA